MSINLHELELIAARAEVRLRDLSSDIRRLSLLVRLAEADDLLAYKAERAIQEEKPE